MYKKMKNDKDVNKANKRKNNLLLLLIVTTFVMLLGISLFAQNITAISVPRGIDGRVYYLDGHTEVFAGVPYEITDLNTGQTITGETGRGSSGRYSVAIPWNDGDIVQVKAYNPSHESLRNITLNGVIHNFDLMLDMNITPMPPEIKSQPKTDGVQDELYSYAVNVFDWNSDNITYFLSQKPAGMNISRGLITWIPNSSQVGNSYVKMLVSDGKFNTTQNFTINVQNINDPPKIISIPQTTIKYSDIYEYKINTTDPDDDAVTLSLTQGPTGMMISNDTLMWTMSATDIGLHEIKITASDTHNATSTQEFTLNVTSDSSGEQGNGDGGGTGTTTGGEQNSTGNETQNNQTNETQTNKTQTNTTKIFTINGTDEFIINAIIPVIKITTKDKSKKTITINEDTSQREEIIRDRFVYDYFSIEASRSDKKESQANAEITFTVLKEWLDKRNLMPEDVVLMKYRKGRKHRKGKWEELDTKVVTYGRYATLSAKTRGFGYFAISHKINAGAKMPEPSIAEMKEPFVITGVIKADYRNVDPSKIDLEFNTGTGKNKSTKAEIFKMPDNQTGYQVTLNAHKKDHVTVYINSIDKEKIAELVLNKNIINKNLEVKEKRNFAGLTGYVVGSGVETDYSDLVILLTIFSALSALLIYVNEKMKKRKLKNAQQVGRKTNNTEAKKDEQKK